jgi:predicted DNA-binding protein YlxM (UPF0122 family)
MTIQEYILQNWKKNTIQMMAEKGGYPEDEVWRVCKKLEIEPIKKSDLNETVVLEYYEKLTLPEIAKKLSISEPSVRNICKKWGINCLTAEEKLKIDTVKEEFERFKKKSYLGKLISLETLQWMRENVIKTDTVDWDES